jgi:hypothetical protein
LIRLTLFDSLQQGHGLPPILCEHHLDHRAVTG